MIIGLIGAAGADLVAATDAVRATLARYDYETVPIRLSFLMREVKGGSFLGGITHEDDRVWQHMDAGDSIRHQTRRNDAIAALALGYISEYRKECHGGAPALATAFVLDSLKHPAEIESLRQIYRDRLIVISVHSPTGARLKALKKRIASSHGKPDKVEGFEAAAKRIMKRDEHDDEHEFGQNVREAFTAGDVYVSTHPTTELEGEVGRFFRLFFGDPFLTPSRDEYAMFQTHAAALRSADLSRQVGAAVCTAEGEIIAVGCNEVPTAFGGQYWPEDASDHRDFQLGYDSNVKYRDEALTATFDGLGKRKQLSDDADLTVFDSVIRGTRLGNITEFGRSMHAEMAALLDAARRGTAVGGQKLFTTTFPCHNCARHIIGAGIREVVYREPYEKSAASDLHSDAVVVDPEGEVTDKVVIRRFVGIGPPRYLSLFTKPMRKDPDGNRVSWSEATATPRLVKTETAYISNEEDFLDGFRESIASVELKRRDDGDSERLA